MSSVVIGLEKTVLFYLTKLMTIELNKQTNAFSENPKLDGPIILSLPDCQ